MKTGMHQRLYLLLFLLNKLTHHVTDCFLLSPSRAELARCPRNIRGAAHVFTYRNWCLQFVLSESIYWDEASAKCKHFGGHLVKIGDSGTQAFIMAALSRLHFQEKFVWIGLNDRLDEQTWRWDNGDRLGNGYTHWAKGQDDNNIFHWAQDCVSLDYSDYGNWYDGDCHIWPEHYNYICQYDMIPLTTHYTMKTTATTSTSTSPSTTTTTTTTTTRTPKPTTTSTSTTSSATTITSPTTSQTTSTRPTTTTTVSCLEVDCQSACPNGYSGLYTGADGCVACRCN